MIVTITGANGFIGYHLVYDQLARGRRVRAVDVTLARLEGLRGHPAVELFQTDIRDSKGMKQAVSGSQVVFHLASAHLSVTLSEEEYWQINCAGSRELVELCHNAGVERFVHCSSVGVYGEIQNPPADEDSACHPDLIYEQSKLEGEQAVAQYGQKTGFPVIIVRPVWVYGPGCPRTEKLFRAIKKQRFFFVGDGQALRHCIYITDLLEAFELCAQHPKAPGRVFLFGDHAAVTVRELIAQIAAVCGVAAPRLSIPMWVFKPVCFGIERAFTLLCREPPVSERSLKFFTNNTSFDISRARRALGFTPKVTLQAGLRLTYAAMNHHE
jgi:nucleoside-diphosphate-sugar epimerase